MLRRRQIQINTAHNQKGIVLIVCLVILVVMTVLGVSTMTSSTLEERMASNSQSMMTTFQATESAIASTLADGTIFTTAMNTPSGASGTYPLGTNLTASTTTTLTGPPTILEGYSLGSFVAYPFDLVATSAQASTGASTQITQGVKRLAPDSN